MAVAVAVGVIALSLSVTLVVDGAAYGACHDPAPKPSQTQDSTDLRVQIGESTPAPTPSSTCEPSPGVTPAASPTANPSGGTSVGSGMSAPRRPRTSGQPPRDSVPSTPAGARGAPVPGSRPSERAAELKLQPSRVNAGAKIQATASGFTPGEQVQLVLYPSPLIVGSYAADQSGAIAITFTVPTDTRTGNHVAEATGWDSNEQANGQFLVTAASTVQGGIPQRSLMLGILVSLLVAAVGVALCFRRSIAAVFVGPRTPRTVS